jgi:hypothetical protein
MEYVKHKSIKKEQGDRFELLAYRIDRKPGEACENAIILIATAGYSLSVLSQA